MKWHISYSYQAYADLRGIRAYIAHALQEPNIARNVYERIKAEIRSLAEFPRRNALYEGELWNSRELRTTNAGNYLILYTITEATRTVTVLRIAYGGRDTHSLLEETPPPAD